MDKPRIAWIRIFWGVLLLLALPPALGLGAEPTPPDEVVEDKESLEAQCYAIFQKLFFSESYNSLKCQDNIFNLLNGIKAANLDLSEVKVLYIFNKHHDQLVPTRAMQKKEDGIQRPDITAYRARKVPTRDEPPNNFRYHVFAVVQNRVLDFDYTNSPAFPTATQYADDMYTDGTLNRRDKKLFFNRLLVRVINSEDYLRQHPQHPSYYLFDLGKKYPPQTLDAYIQTLAVRKFK